MHRAASPLALHTALLNILASVYVCLACLTITASVCTCRCVGVKTPGGKTAFANDFDVNKCCLLNVVAEDACLRTLARTETRGRVAPLPPTRGRFFATKDARLQLDRGPQFDCGSCLYEAIVLSCQATHSLSMWNLGSGNDEARPLALDCRARLDTY
eukprot:3963852-Pleurochrysis_carterae.AAC.1